MQNLRIIPNLEIKEEFVVKGYQYEGVKKIDYPNKLAELFYKTGADELIFIDTVASLYRRNSLLEIIKENSKNIFIPLTVGGGIRSLKNIYEILRAGADKVAINTYATKNKKFLKDASKEFGSQCIVLFIQAKLINDEYFCLTDNSRENSGLKVTDWIKTAENLGVGEILLSSVDRDGTRIGFDIPLIKKALKISSIPIIPHGGCGDINDIISLQKQTELLNAVSFSSIAYEDRFDIKVIKKKLKRNGINVRK